MRKVFITSNPKQTRKLGQLLAQEIKEGGIICLTGELGSGKTTFTQGLLRGLKIEGPHTSPTFVVIKSYKNIYHIDAYRVTEEDILNLGWEEMISDKNNIVIVEWADRIQKIIPKNSIWIEFQWVNNNTRKIKIYSEFKS